MGRSIDFGSEFWYNGGMVPTVHSPGSPDDMQDAEVLDRFRSLTLRDSPEIRRITDSIRSEVNDILLSGTATTGLIMAGSPSEIQEDVLETISLLPDGPLKQSLVNEIRDHADLLDSAIATSAPISAAAPTPRAAAPLSSKDTLQKFMDMKEKDLGVDALLVEEEIRSRINRVMYSDDVKRATHQGNMPLNSIGHQLGTNDVLEIQPASEWSEFQTVVSILLMHVQDETKEKIYQILAEELPEKSTKPSSTASTLAGSAGSTVSTVGTKAKDVAAKGVLMAGSGVKGAMNIAGKGWSIAKGPAAYVGKKGMQAVRGTGTFLKNLALWDVTRTSSLKSLPGKFFSLPVIRAFAAPFKWTWQFLDHLDVFSDKFLKSGNSSK